MNIRSGCSQTILERKRMAGGVCDSLTTPLRSANIDLVLFADCQFGANSSLQQKRPPSPIGSTAAAWPRGGFFVDSVNVTEWSEKWTDLSSFARQKAAASAKASVIKFYDKGITENSLNSIREGVETWKSASSTRSEALNAWLPNVARAIGYGSNVADFMSSEHAAWLAACSSDFRTTISSLTVSHHDAPHIFFHPKSHLDAPDIAWNESGVIDQRYMYADRHAAAQWAEIRARETYGLYNICKTLARESGKFIHAVEPNIDQIIFLGAGSPDKDWSLIIEVMKDRESPLDVFVCDASFYMLIETKDELEKLMLSNRKHINTSLITIHLSCFDFTKPNGWKSCKLDKNRKTLIVIFGGTVGNVSEKDLFDCIRSNSKADDLIIIAGSFYESQEDIESRGSQDIAQQYGDDAKGLAINTISALLDKVHGLHTFKEKVDFVSVEFEDASDLPDRISSRIPDTKSAVFFISTAKLSKIYPNFDGIERLFLLTSRRYVKGNLKAHLEQKYSLAHLKDFDDRKGKFPFSHLIFQRT
jgi:Histidine-specific methyltransferase, SAM-dependent